jgi:pimeloyl-ACP methyl ester carboxylesterase
VAELKLAAIDVKAGAAMESQSGLQMLRPRIYGAYAEPDRKKVAAIVMHPTSNFMGHYLIRPLADRGICCMGLNSRYVGNDAVLLMERVIQDLGAGVKHLRALGYEKVVLIGNSGGAALASFYQAQAENLTVDTLVDGDPTQLSPDDLPPVDGIVLCAAHEGRSQLFLRWVDPSVVDEGDALSADPALDMYNPANGPAYSPEFLARFSAGQHARRERIEAWVWRRLRQLRGTPGAPRDQAFVVHRTHADPRCLDLGLDANDRAPGSVWGDARAVNCAANAMGRYTSLTAFLSQWSSASRAEGPGHHAKSLEPALMVNYTADQSTFPSTRAAWLAAAEGRISNVDIRGGNHYLAGQPELVLQAADAIAAWVDKSIA